MTTLPLGPLCDPVLVACCVPHGFGQRASQVPDSTVFPDQVHGTASFEVESVEASEATPEADVVLTAEPDVCVGIVTADCLPILIASADGHVVAAVHAGWRGLAAGVLEVGLSALRARSKALTASRSLPMVVAAIGPAAGGCCYEIDEPVRAALSERYSADLSDCLTESRSDHFLLDLPALARLILERNGVEKHQIGMQNTHCTICSGSRFESYRRDGQDAGRLRHFITRPGSPRHQG